MSRALPWWRFDPGWLELSDRVVGPAPIARDGVVAACLAEGNRMGAAIAGRLPADGAGVLIPEAIDRVLVAAHRELQRLALELQQAPRTWARLAPLVAAVRRATGRRRVRVADVGCGIGYVLRALALSGADPDVEWVGVDLNGALIAEARRWAAREGARVSFVAGDAFAPGEGADLWMSTGVLHHLGDLPAFFAAQVAAGGLGFVHSDFQPSALAPLGSWVFHQARMRVPLARHDGILSAVRAHPGDRLLSAARAGAPRWEVALEGVHVARWLRLPRAMHTLVGRAPELR